MESKRLGYFQPTWQSGEVIVTCNGRIPSLEWVVYGVLIYFIANDNYSRIKPNNVCYRFKFC